MPLFFKKRPLVLVQGTDAVTLTGVSEAISQQIAKYDSSEFDDDKVSKQCSR